MGLKKIIALTTLMFTAGANAKLVNGGIHAGSIRDYVPNLKYLSFQTNFHLMKGPAYAGKYRELFLYLKDEYTEKTVKPVCQKYDKDNMTVYYGLDNIAFSQRQIETPNGELGQEIVATFNIFCTA